MRIWSIALVTAVTCTLLAGTDSASGRHHKHWGGRHFHFRGPNHGFHRHHFNGHPGLFFRFRVGGYPWYSHPFHRYWHYFPRYRFFSYGYRCGCPMYSYPGGYGNYGFFSGTTPTNADTQAAFGPQAVKQFMGAGRQLALQPINQDLQVPKKFENPEDPFKSPAGQVVNISNLKSRQRAARFVERGDGLFRQQKFNAALQRYKSAAQFAPDLATAHFRKGLALIALGKYDLASTAYRQGLRVDPTWIQTGFRLDLIYQDNRTSKTTHLESLASVALRNPANADLLFLVGTFLYFDGQQDRSLRFFQRAAELSSNRDTHVASFLEAMEQSAAKQGKETADSRI